MSKSSETETQRGRESERPDRIPRRGWRDILLRTKEQIDNDNVGLMAAGLSFYALLAVFPGLAALVSLYGLVADAAEVQSQFQALSALVPGDAWELLGEQMSRVASSGDGTLSLAAAFSLLLALWSASRATKAFIIAMNVAYNQRESRNIIKQNLMALALTLFLILLVLVALAVTVAVPAVLALVGLDSGLEWLITVLRWPLMAVVFMVALAALYRYAPCRRDAKWRWVTPGSVAAIVLWLVASIGFSVYVTNFGSYNETYGSIGAVVALMLWFWISAFVVIMGAELNAETEHQTSRDSTTGKPKPIGKRGAYVADTVGEPR